MGKHAYLILAHDRFGQLEQLLSCLDHERNDIFLHVDKKSSYDSESLCRAVSHSGLYFTDRIKVSWGAFSIVEATFLLLEMAVKQGEYDYYHLLSGRDLPLRPQEEIHAFFDNHCGREFVSLSAEDVRSNSGYKDRIRYYYPFQEMFGRNSIAGKVLRAGGLLCQKLMRVDRLRSCGDRLGIGSQFFSITDAFARYVVSQKAEVKNRFGSGFCVDELFLQTLYLNSPFFERGTRYDSGHEEHPYIQNIYFDVVRAIDWVRGEPYTYREEDLAMLLESGCLFARKFDEAVDCAVIEQIVSRVKKMHCAAR